MRCVCKQWDKVSRDPWLHNMRLARARALERQTLFLITRSPMDAIDETSCVQLFTQHFTHREKLLNYSEGFILHSCDGLLCTVKEALIPQVIVSNPFTREQLTVPPPFHSSVSTQQFRSWFDSFIQKYKVVCVFVDQGHRMFGQVYTIGTSSSLSWRDTMSQPAVPICVYADSVYVSGRARHWMVDYRPGHASDLETMVISFDFTKEEFKTIPCQEFFSVSESYGLGLVDLGGYLGMVHFLSLGGHIQIWKLKDVEKNLWVRECRIDVRQRVELVGLVGEDDIVFLRKAFEPDDRPNEFDELLAYDVETRTWRKLYSFTDIPLAGFPNKAFLLQTRISVLLGQ